MHVQGLMEHKAGIRMDVKRACEFSHRLFTPVIVAVRYD